MGHVKNQQKASSVCVRGNKALPCAGFASTLTWEVPASRTTFLLFINDSVSAVPLEQPVWTETAFVSGVGERGNSRGGTEIECVCTCRGLCVCVVRSWRPGRVMLCERKAIRGFDTGFDINFRRIAQTTGWRLDFETTRRDVGR